MKSVPEGTTRVAMVKNGEADLAMALEGEDAERARRDPRLRLIATRHASLAWIEFSDQWDAKSPWHDRRLRLAVNYALDRKALNDSACLGHCPPTGVIVPRVMDFALPVEPPPYDPQRAKQLLAEAGYPNGLEAGDFVPIPPFLQLSEGAVNFLNAVGIRVRLRPAESRSSFTRREATPTAAIRTLTSCSTSRLASATPRKRQALLHRIQQLTVDRAMFAPIMDMRALTAVGPRVAEDAIGLVPMAFFPSWEDMRLKDR